MHQLRTRGAAGGAAERGADLPALLRNSPRDLRQLFPIRRRGRPHGQRRTVVRGMPTRDALRPV
ncbi:hypothetical protein CC117_27820 [Parafrankia colletiae]|uniref:Uncharacterized protein n=1 Tax=Parafrankia colletiae TaxID=573497 RepID=A0A1S1Q968_9ACTN|nr:hypothetical protein CC117_27820 [Parafrankia colletiae]